VRLLVVVGASGALVAGPGDLSQVVLADVPYGSRLRLSMTGTRPSDRLGRFRAARSIG
jgi:hypothetical protein